MIAFDSLHQVIDMATVTISVIAGSRWMWHKAKTPLETLATCVCRLEALEQGMKQVELGQTEILRLLTLKRNITPRQASVD